MKNDAEDVAYRPNIWIIWLPNCLLLNVWILERISFAIASKTLSNCLAFYFLH